MSTLEQDVVARMCAAWATRDPELVVSHFHVDAVYHNMPMDPVRGVAAIRQFVSAFLAGVDKVEFEVIGEASAGALVMNERIDRFLVEGREVNLPVAGVFEVHDGLITAWRDYFDRAHAAGLSRDVPPSARP